MLRKQSNQCQRGTEAAKDGNIDKVQKGLVAPPYTRTLSN